MLAAAWRGASGAGYRFQVNRLSWRPAAGMEGNFVFARQARGEWQAVLIGQGDVQKGYDAALRKRCVLLRGATHFHVHPNGDRQKRLDEMRDLIAGNPECRGPRGCNL